ncbi:hypothetical protein D3C71_1871440 [compost metagenome]
MLGERREAGEAPAPIVEVAVGPDRYDVVLPRKITDQHRPRHRLSVAHAGRELALVNQQVDPRAVLIHFGRMVLRPSEFLEPISDAPLKEPAPVDRWIILEQLRPLRL